MFARISTFQNTPDRVEEGMDYVRKQIVPAVQEIAGFKGLYALIDRQSGKSLSITLWDNEESMRASEEAANHIRNHGAAASGDTIVSVERYEVSVHV